MTQHSHRIKTNIKFKQNENGAFYGFVTKDSRGSWRGCRETDAKKKIVFVDKDKESDIIPDALYQCSLIPMKSESGFIAINVKLMKFEAHIETEVTDNLYRVTVTFGHTAIVYNPQSTNPQKNNIQTVARLLRSRHDLKYKEAVAEEFCDNAYLLFNIYKKRKQ